VIPAQAGQQPGMSWSVPVPRRTGSYAAPVMPAPLRARKSGKPHWGLRFVLLLFVAGGVTYFLRPSVPWIHARLTGVESGLRGVAERYGLMTSATAPIAQPASPSAPAAAPATSPPVVAAPASRNAAAGEGASGNRPEVTPLPPRPGMPPAEPGARPGMQRGIGNRRFVREVGMPRARGAAAMAVRPRAAARRSGAARGAAARQQFSDPVITFGDGDESPPPSEPPRARRAAAARRQARLALIQKAAARPAEKPAAEETAAAPAPEAPPAPSAEPAAVEAAPPPPAEAAPPAPAPAEKRSVVGEALRSGDELDRLMASAVVESRAAGGRAAPAAPPVERRSAAPEARERAQVTADATKDAARPTLSRSEIMVVMKDVQKAMPDCYRRHGQQGAAEVRIQVDAEGQVAGAIVRGALANTPTAGCVEARLKQAVFPASRGMTFDYRLMVK
jgi:outer membrane biosynthesis protein TonB